MTVIWYLIFLAVTFVVALQIFRFTTYHAYFFKASPILLAYSIAVGYCLFRFGLAPFFLWHIFASAVLFYLKWASQAHRAKALIEQLSDEPGPHQIAKLSISNTRAYFLLSALIYLLGFTVSFLIFYNLPRSTA